MQQGFTCEAPTSRFKGLGCCKRLSIGNAAGGVFFSLSGLSSAMSLSGQTRIKGAERSRSGELGVGSVCSLPRCDGVGRSLHPHLAPTPSPPHPPTPTSQRQSGVTVLHYSTTGTAGTRLSRLSQILACCGLHRVAAGGSRGEEKVQSHSR